MTSTTPTPVTRLFSFIASDTGTWQVTSAQCVVGEPLPAATAISVVAGDMQAVQEVQARAIWQLHGITSNERYVQRTEKTELVAKQEGLGRAASTCAAIIPIRKNAAWWAMTQDERREVLEAQSHHIAIGMRYLPAIARRLHHCRDLAPNAPFDFITWFEFAPQEVNLFDDLVSALRATPEWTFVDRESDIRLNRV